jgi:hypothetical protein
MKRYLPLAAIGLLAAVVAAIVVGTLGSSPAPRRPVLTHRPRSSVTSAIPTPTAATAASTATGPGTTPTTSTAASSRPAAVYQCDQNIDATSRSRSSEPVVCSLAETAFYEVYRAARTAPAAPARVEVWDAAASAYVAMACHDAHGQVSCVARDGRASTFPMLAVREYTPALAARFRAGRDLGPAG